MLLKSGKQYFKTAYFTTMYINAALVSTNNLLYNSKCLNTTESRCNRPYQAWC